MLSRAADRYEFRALVKHGRTGSMYGARDRLSERSVSIKLLPFDLRDKSAREAFERRAQRLCRLRTPYVAPALDFGYHYGLAYVVSEGVAGHTLDKYLRRGAMTSEQFGAIFHALLTALTAAHAEGLVHGDIQPSHIVLTDDGQIVTGLVLTGFGFPDLANEDASVSEDTRHVSNVDAIAPERLLRQSIDARLDLYAAGATAYEMLSGTTPFAGRSLNQVFRAIYEDPPPLGTVLPDDHDIPDAVLELIANLLKKSPMDRPASAADARFWLESGAQLGSLDLRDATIPVLTDVELSAYELADDIAAARPQVLFDHVEGAERSSTTAPAPVRSDSLSPRQIAQVTGLLVLFFLFALTGWMLVMKATPPAASPSAPAPAVATEEPESTDGTSELREMFSEIDRALDEGRWGTAESLIGRLEESVEFPDSARGTLRAYRSRLELSSQLQRARRLEESGKLEEALLVYWDLRERFPRHATVPDSIERLEKSFVLDVDANVRGVLYVDGEPVGVTPFVGIIPIAARDVSVARKGYRTWTRSIAAQKATRLELEAELVRRKRSEKPDRREVDLEASPFMDLMDMELD